MKKTFLWCLQNPTIDFNLIFANILNFETNIPLCTHLWYICSYIKCVLWYPILNLICKDEKEAKNARKIIGTLIFIGIIVMVIQNFYLLPCGRIEFFAEKIDKSILWVLIGTIIYKNINKIKENKKARIIGAIMVIIGNIIRVIAQYFACKYDINNQVFLSWGYGFTYITAIGLAIFVLSLDFKRTKVNNIILFLAYKTYYIYLIHWCVMEKLKIVSENIFNLLGKNEMSFLGENIYTIINICMVFIISLILATIVEFTCKLIKKAICDVKNKCIKEGY